MVGVEIIEENVTGHVLHMSFFSQQCIRNIRDDKVKTLSRIARTTLQNDGGHEKIKAILLMVHTREILGTCDHIVATRMFWCGFLTTENYGIPFDHRIAFDVWRFGWHSCDTETFVVHPLSWWLAMWPHDDCRAVAARFDPARLVSIHDPVYRWYHTPNLHESKDPPEKATIQIN